MPLQEDTLLRYRLVIAGRLDSLWVGRLYEAEIRDVSTPAGETLTELSGGVPDHAALLGILNMVHDLGLIIRRVDVETVTD